MRIEEAVDNVTLVPGSLRTLIALFRLRRLWSRVAGTLFMVLVQTHIRLYVHVGWFERVQLLPDTSLFFRFALPRT